jgi:hypothetical protein
VGFLVHDVPLALIAAAASAFLSGPKAESRNSSKEEQFYVDIAKVGGLLLVVLHNK